MLQLKEKETNENSKTKKRSNKTARSTSCAAGWHACMGGWSTHESIKSTLIDNCIRCIKKGY